MSNIMQSLIDTTEKFLQESIDIPILDSGILEDYSRKHSNRKNYVSSITIKNAKIGNVIISMDTELAKHILHKLFNSSLDGNEIENYIEDVVMEVLNTVIGNSTQALAASGNPISFTIPSPFIENVDDMKRKNPSIWQWNVITVYGGLQLLTIYNN